MAHNLDFTTGKAGIAFRGNRNDIWHRHGQQMEAGMSIDQWAKAAGLDWYARKVPAYADVSEDATPLRHLLEGGHHGRPGHGPSHTHRGVMTMYLEYNWTACCYQPRFGDTFTSVNGWCSFETLEQARAELALAGLKLGRKTDSRTWRIEVALDCCPYHKTGGDSTFSCGGDNGGTKS
jgi:hypothetical protein